MIAYLAGFYILYALGAPIGNKTKNKFLVPEWILSSKGCSRRFLQGLFDDELAAIKIKRKKFLREAALKLTRPILLSS